MQSQYQAAMLRALELALLGPYQGVNPQVGCVILDPENQIVAEGFHKGSGTDHAEVMALKNLKAALGSEKLPAGYTAVVSLEPCNHTGKTGPCAVALIEAGISRVVFASTDPGDVSGSGSKTLQAAGVDVVAGFMQSQADYQSRVWLTANRSRRPFVTLKWGSSLDGRTAAQDGSSKWITSEASRADVHLARSRADAILVGTNTVLVDNPELTARKADGSLYENQPLRIVLGESELPGTLRVFDSSAPTLQLKTRDVGLALAELWQQGIKHVFVEGGAAVAGSFLRENLVDELLIYLAPKLIGGEKLAIGNLGVESIEDAIELEILEQKNFDADIFLRAKLRSN